MAKQQKHNLDVDNLGAQRNLWATASSMEETSGGEQPIRVGSTTRDPRTRAKEYENEGYCGTMYTAKSDNIMVAEDQLLDDYPGKYNIQLSSGVQPVPGYVYIIMGSRYIYFK